MPQVFAADSNLVKTTAHPKYIDSLVIQFQLSILCRLRPVPTKDDISHAAASEACAICALLARKNQYSRLTFRLDMNTTFLFPARPAPFTQTLAQDDRTAAPWNIFLSHFRLGHAG
jgi:hypothetical protein